MMPPEVIVEIFGGDAAMAMEKVLEARKEAVDRLNVETAPHPFCHASRRCASVRIAIPSSQVANADSSIAALLPKPQSPSR